MDGNFEYQICTANFKHKSDLSNRTEAVPNKTYLCNICPQKKNVFSNSEIFFQNFEFYFRLA